MIYQAEVLVREPSFLRLQYKESIQLNKPYNVYIRCSKRILEFFSDTNTPLGFVEIEKLSMRQKMSEQNEAEVVPSKSKSKKQPKDQSGKRQEPPERSVSAQGRFQFQLFKNGEKKTQDTVILSINTKSKGLRGALKFVMESKSDRRSSDPLAFQPSKHFNISLLSSESPQQRYRGFLNLAMILLVVLNFRNIVTNIKKYGVQQLPSSELTFHFHSLLFITLGLGSHIVACFGVTYKLFSKKMSLLTSTIINSLNVGVLLVSNICYSLTMNPGFATQTGITMLTAIVSLKLISYIQVNNSIYRLAEQINTDLDAQKYKDVSEHVKDQVKTHRNNLTKVLTLQRLVYFIVAPTLCYQLEYPRNSYIRKLWLAKRVAEYIVTTLVMNILIIQYIFPELEDIKNVYASRHYNYAQFVFRIIQISVPCMLYWVLMFYSFFHVLLNIIAEITRFGDRAFYEDWWNCKDHDQYWKKWNMPVHNWMLRHLYIPMIGVGFTKFTASFTVFFVSALYHEYWIGVPLRVLSFWAFLAIMLQAPVIAIQKYSEKKLQIRNSELGNVVFWLSFCFIGQPLVLFAYYYMYTTSKS